MIILIVILIFLGLILYLPVCIDVKYIGGVFSYKVSYAFIKFYPKPVKKVKRRKVKSKKKSLNVKESKQKKVAKESSKSDSKMEKSKEGILKSNLPIDSDSNALDTLNLLLDIFKAIKEKLGDFITSVKITNLYINFQVADIDAFDCALKFGKLNIVLGNILGFLQRNFKVKKKSINIQPKYNSHDSLYDISFKIKLGLGKGLTKILIMIFKVLPILKENDKI
ncbi:MAG: DUF2953 domain-containing protein [Ruminococcus sp.]|nr:DUF2953 domain-containing protein [Ruminococcus sp.]